MSHLQTYCQSQWQNLHQWILGVGVVRGLVHLLLPLWELEEVLGVPLLAGQLVLECPLHWPELELGLQEQLLVEEAWGMEEEGAPRGLGPL